MVAGPFPNVVIEPDGDLFELGEDLGVNDFFYLGEFGVE